MLKLSLFVTGVMLAVPVVFGTLSRIFGIGAAEGEDETYLDPDGRPYRIVDLPNGMEYAEYID